MSTQIEEAVRDELALRILDMAKPLVAVKVAKEVEGLSVEERLTRLEIQSQMAYDLTNTQGKMMGQEIRDLNESLDYQAEGLMSIIFRLFSHVTGHALSTEQIQQIKHRANDLAEQSNEEPDPTKAGAFVEQATREILGG